MLHVWDISGQQLAAVDTTEPRVVQVLKEQLRELYGYPVCLQRLMLQGTCVEDDAQLQEPLDLQLVELSQLPLQPSTAKYNAKIYYNVQ